MTLNPPSPIVRRILEHLAALPTDGHGYKALRLAEHTTEETDRALALLFQAGLVNAFVKPSRVGEPAYYPSSLTPAGRSVIAQICKPGLPNDRDDENAQHAP